MDSTRSGKGHDELIEDYLFRGYQPRNTEDTTDSDQQFAKPIEDEDMFADLVSDNVPTTSHQTLKRKRWAALKELCKIPAPRKFAADCDEDGMVGIGDIEVVPEEPESKSTAKEIFHKATLRRVKDKYGLYKGQKLYWDRYNDYLHRKISSDKRKRWESLHSKLDKFDDEEELVGDWTRDEEDKSDEEDPVGELDRDDKADPNQEELVRGLDHDSEDEVDQDESVGTSDRDDGAVSDREESVGGSDCDDNAASSQEEPVIEFDQDDEDVSDQEESFRDSDQEGSESDLDLGNGAAGLLLDEADCDDSDEDELMKDSDCESHVESGEEDEVL